MNPALLKGLIGIGVLGTTTAASVGGYYWLSAPKTIGDKLKGKVLVGDFMTSDTDEKNKSLWTTKKSSYSTGAQSEDEEILKKADISEKALSDKCKEILETSLNPAPENLNKKENWAKKWCFKDDSTV